MTTFTTVTIQKIVNGGYGLGQLASGQIFLARHTLPNEIVTISIEEIKRNYLVGRIQEINSPHPDRRKPPCPYYSRCGGCSLQHCQYSMQLDIKKTILSELLQRENGIRHNDHSPPISDPIPSHQELGYRHRVRLKIDNKNRIGYYEHRSHNIVEIEQCLLAVQEINETLKKLKKHPAIDRILEHSQEVEILQNPGTGRVTLIFQFDRRPRPTDIQTARTLCDDVKLLEQIFFKGKDFQLKGYVGDGPVATAHLNCTYENITRVIALLEYRWEIGAFSQVNIGQNRNLIRLVLDLCKACKDDRISDLFCGMGNFSIPLAMQAGELLGIEGQGAAIRSAKNNAEHASVSNTLFIKDNVHKRCLQLAQERERFDITVVDPPRQGIPGLATTIAKITRKKLVYISCDPATLCRDLADLTTAGFLIKRIQPIDMFPQTHHLETVVLLEKQHPDLFPSA